MKPPPRRSRLLVFVIAYCAEGTLLSVLERIPRSVFDDFDCEILVVDDASEDRTFAIGREYQASHPAIPMTVLRNEFNQGYGGNQKVGYAHAIAKRFDFVVMVHGDGQYAPEELPLLLAPLVRGEADAVFGSRMLQRFSALRGGMPLYKFIGNRVLTALQNRLLRSRLSEFHSGYRAYSIATLARIPFWLDSNDFHFDTEIVIQLLNARARLAEVPISTHYGDEICRVNGARYAKDVLVATLQNVAHRSGILYQRRFDVTPDTPPTHDMKEGYPSSHTYALEAVPAGARVLDIGAGPASFTSALVEKGCHVAIADRSPGANVPGAVLHVQDLDADLTFDVRPYDCILLLDILEHLRDPERFVADLRRQFDYAPKKIILTTPNVAFIVQRVMLLFGEFNYGKAGILDKTHTRLFTYRAIRQLLRDEGFRVERVRGVPAPFPKALGEGRLARLALAVNLALIRVSKTLFSYQLYIEASSTPHVDFVLRSSRERSAADR